MDHLEIWMKGTLVACVFILVALALLSLSLLTPAAWFFVLPIIGIIGCGVLIAYGLHEPRRCVMCGEVLKDQDESIIREGAHEWCQNYY